MRTQDLLRAQFEHAHNVIEQVIDDCSEETLTNVADGTIGSISAIYAHAVFDEDGWIARPAGWETLWARDQWSTKTSLEMPGPMQTEEWARSGPSYNFAAFREYARAVYAQTDQYLAGVSDEDLEVEVPAAGGTMSVARWVGAAGLWHMMSHQGEIAALKGVQGLKGLPY